MLEHENSQQTHEGDVPEAGTHEGESQSHKIRVVIEGEGDSVEEAETPPASVGDAAHRAAVQELEQRLAQAERDAREYKDQWLRTVADLKNYKRRAEAERDELKRSASASLLLKLLPVVDDFERAVGSVPPEIASSAWWEGTGLIAQKLRLLLESEGVKPIESIGQEFDPNYHHAVAFEDADGQDGKVVEELQKGYMQHERVIRPSMVKVGRSPSG